MEATKKDYHYIKNHLTGVHREGQLTTLFLLIDDLPKANEMLEMAANKLTKKKIKPLLEIALSAQKSFRGKQPILKFGPVKLSFMKEPMPEMEIDLNVGIKPLRRLASTLVKTLKARLD